MTKGLALARLSEVADVLRAHGDLPCAPSIDEEDGQVTLTVRLHAADVGHALERLEVLAALQRVADVAQLRGFSDRYGIPAEKLEALLPAEDVDVAAARLVGPEPLTLDELAALVSFVESDYRLVGREVATADQRVLVALQKLRAIMIAYAEDL